MCDRGNSNAVWMNFSHTLSDVVLDSHKFKILNLDVKENPMILKSSRYVL